LCLDYEQYGSCAGPEVGFEEILIDFPPSPFLDLNLGSITGFVDCVGGESKYHYRVFGYSA